MGKILIGFFVFCLVLFIYLHIQFHLKTSNDLEIYEVDDCSKEKLEEICDLRQPVLFDLDNKKMMETTNQDFLLKHYSAFEIKIRNTNDLANDLNSELYIPLSFDLAKKLFQEDKESIYISENNEDFLKETGSIKNMSYQDEMLRPYMVSNCNYDIIMGSTNTHTVFRYEINYRNFFLLTQGSAQIKLAPPQSSRYLQPIYDYENFEFKSPVNPWDPQAKYKAEFDKIKCLEFTLIPGKTLFIPAFWWYSIRIQNSETCISSFKYKTYMNNLANLPYVIMYGLQIQNIKRNTNKKVSIHEEKNETTIFEKEMEIKNEKEVAFNNSSNQNEMQENENIQDSLPLSCMEASTSLLNEISIGSTLLE